MCAADGFIPSFAVVSISTPPEASGRWDLSSLSWCSPSSSVATAGDEEVKPWWFRFAKVPGTSL
jgi:hypothetical protein